MFTKKIKVKFVDFEIHAQNFLLKKGAPESELVCRIPLYKLLSSGFDLELSENPDFLIYLCFGKSYLQYGCVRIYYSSENILPPFAEFDHEFSFGYCNLPNYTHISRIDSELADLINQKRDLKALIQEKTQFCNFVYYHNYVFRNRFFKKLSRYNRVNAPDRVMNNMPPTGQNLTTKQSRYAYSFHESKLGFLRPYKFTIAFENSLFTGYSTKPSDRLKWAIYKRMPYYLIVLPRPVLERYVWDEVEHFFWAIAEQVKETFQTE